MNTKRPKVNIALVGSDGVKELDGQLFCQLFRTNIYIMEIIVNFWQLDIAVSSTS